MNQEQLRELLSDMSLTEKIGQLVQINGTFFEEEDSFATGPARAMGLLEEDKWLCGSVLNVVGAEKIIALQKEYMEKHPHHIPMLFMLDVINGYRTIFPIPLAQGCMFDLELSELIAKVSAIETAAAGQHLTFSPMADLVQDARWGRVMESTGEDPYLNELCSAATVLGYQGNDLKEKGRVAACVKHFAGYGQPVGGREYNTVELSERTLMNDYMSGYRGAINAGCETVMTSFNPLNRIPSTANKHLMREILRKQLGFDGVLISDWEAVYELIQHGIATDAEEAARLAVEASVDIDMVTSIFARELPKLVKKGVIAETMIDEAVMRILQLKNKLGLFENPYKDASKEDERKLILCAEHRDAARKAACESFVLLKNQDELLPLPKEGQKIAFLGPYAENVEIHGAWSMFGRSEDSISIRGGIEGKGIKASYAKGCGILTPGTRIPGFGSYIEAEMDTQTEASAMEAAVKLAKESDVAVLCLGEHRAQSGEGGSRTDIRLSANQRLLVHRVSEVNENIIIVLFSGRPLEIVEEEVKAKAILQVWFPGTEGGNAIADVLFGDVIPGGKLSMSFPHSVGQVPITYRDFRTGRPLGKDSTEIRYISKYQDCPNEPLYSFGYGLSYTEFAYSDIRLSSNQMDRSETIKASVIVTNTGKRTGKETVQMYLRDVAGSVIRPVRELKGFEKIELQPGESKEVSFLIKEEMLRFYTIDMCYTSEPGEFEVFIGSDSRTLNGARFTLV